MVGAPVYANVAHATFTPYHFRVTFSLLTVPHDQTSGSLAKGSGQGADHRRTHRPATFDKILV